MSGWGERAFAAGLAAVLFFGVINQQSSAQDIVPVWPTMDPPTAPALAPAPSAVAPASPQQPIAPVKPTAAVAAPQRLAEAQLDQLLAPIALYPDPLLGDVLMASTYPQEVAEAARWVRAPANRALVGGALTAAVKANGWNPSVAALTPFPSLLVAMADRLDWTRQLGKAFLTQQGDVLGAVQQLRHAAMTASNLRATPECHCIIQTSGDIISIQPSDSELVGVPVYDPAIAYGNWAEAAHPPATFPLPPGFAVTPGNVVAFNPAIDVALFGPIWGWGSIDWPNRRIVVDEARYKALDPGHIGFTGGVWVREPPSGHKIARDAPTVVARLGHHAKAKARRHLVATVAPLPPPPYWWDPRYRAWGPPPGAVVPPPPPRYIARNWYNGYYVDPYR